LYKNEFRSPGSRCFAAPWTPDGRSSVEAISALAKSLGIGLVAEGVEDAHQAEFMRARYCTELQGFLFSRPVPAEELPGMVARIQPEAELRAA
jgi:EAL domain-containing protein (putative c-di-GMP-specific phosphodiesterase class I)